MTRVPAPIALAVTRITPLPRRVLYVFTPSPLAGGDSMTRVPAPNETEAA